MHQQARERRIKIVKRHLLRTSAPRLQVSLILSLTGLAGLLTSFSLLRLGVPWMWLRYPVAILVAYCVFLLLLRLWLWLQQHGGRGPEVDFGLPGVDLDFGSAGATGRAASFRFGGGGDFAGGGAGGSWGGSATASPSGAGGSSFSDVISFDLEEGWLVVLAVVAVIGGLIACFYVIYIAPALLAEILVDGALLAGLYKRIKRVERRHWLRAAVRRTLLPALLAAIFFTAAGYALQQAVPEARSVGEVWHQLTKS